MALSLISISVGTILLSLYVTEFSKGWFRRKLWDLVCFECREENKAFLRAASGSGQIWS